MLFHFIVKVPAFPSFLTWDASILVYIDMASLRSHLETPATEVETYYDSTENEEVQQAFKNLDDATYLDRLMHLVQSSSTRNFVLDFSDSTAYVAFDLSTTAVSALLDAQRPECLNTRWVNVWYPQHHGPLLELLAKRYDFSPRLLVLMSSDPKMARASQSSLPAIVNGRQRLWRASSRQKSSDSDVEKGLDELSELTSISSNSSVKFGNLYKIINDLWHYSSIDFGRNYICIGYNSLYGTKHTGQDCGPGPLPHCIRVWTWLLLCKDNTVISINEDPFPLAEEKLDTLQLRILAEIRRNLVNVFRALSAVEVTSLKVQHPMCLLPLRTRLGDTPEESAHRETDIPGLLFYYLFENWHNTYTLITRRESRYGVELNDLRTEMFDSPQMCHVDRLDGVGKELGVLKRHYESYQRIIDRLLERPDATAASLRNLRVVSEASQASLDTIRPLVTERESMLGVAFSSAARVRFERLRDLIELYALSEIEDYIKQKDALVTMVSLLLLFFWGNDLHMLFISPPSCCTIADGQNFETFNLLAIKESLDVERLTRITLLLTKCTILFLPVSFMATYFAVPLANVGAYTVADFWVSFAVVLVLSWGALLVFGVFSGSVQTGVFFRELGMGLRGVGRWIGRLAGT